MLLQNLIEVGFSNFNQNKEILISNYYRCKKVVKAVIKIIPYCILDNPY